MKRCPTCQQAYTDEALQFCRVDGTLLISDTSASGESPTRFLGPSGQMDRQPTEMIRDHTSEGYRTTSAFGTGRPPSIPPKEDRRSGISRRTLAITTTVIVL